MHLQYPSGLWRLAAGMVIVVLAGCTSSGKKAPVEERSTAAKPPATASAPQPAAEAPTKALPGAENSGKPGFYSVKPGDTLVRIALDQGLNWSTWRAGTTWTTRTCWRSGRCCESCRRPLRRLRQRHAPCPTPAASKRGRWTAGLRLRHLPQWQPRPPVRSSPHLQRRSHRLSQQLRRRLLPTARSRHAMPAPSCSGPGRPRARWRPASTKAATRA